METQAAQSRLTLPQVTLCAATSVNVAATIRALEASLARIDFAACLLFTDARPLSCDPAISIIPIPPLTSAHAYSHFMLASLFDHIGTSHCLVVQWDGHVVDAGRWDPAFLDHDFIGASWPQFGDGWDVGNGGFSLRSRRLLAACRAPAFRRGHPEDLMIGRVNRAWLEGQGLRFAPRDLANRFSAERVGDPGQSFGYHGVWHMPSVLGVERFWEIYGSLDARGSIRRDLGTLMRQVAKGRGGAARAARLLGDRLGDALYWRHVRS